MLLKGGTAQIGDPLVGEILIIPGGLCLLITRSSADNMVSANPNNFFRHSMTVKVEQIMSALFRASGVY